jgi:hypothetical protein
METMQEGRWNNARLDDLNGRVSELGRRMDEGFARVDVDLRDIRGEMNARFEHVDARFDALQRTMLQLGGGIVVALIGLIATQL